MPGNAGWSEAQFPSTCPEVGLEKGGSLIATTRFMDSHIRTGMTIAQSMAEGFGYGQNLDKTQDGELISCYECDWKTADAEFMLAKAKYKAVTGREQKREQDRIYYQIRQSFLPGEISPEEANKVGYELAMRWTKGAHAFFVATHTDTRHIHNHIYFNSTALDCTRKFRDFYGSAFALRRLSDRICIEHELSYIANPKPHSKGQYKHYGQWLGDKKPPSYKERLKAQIDACLSDGPESWAAFLEAMEAAGYEVRQSRGAVSFRAPGQERPTRLRAETLGEGYSVDHILAVIQGRAPWQGSTGGGGRRNNLIINIQARMRDGKGPAYQQWAKVWNLKQMAQTVQFLQENDLMEYSQLEARATQAADRFHELADEIRAHEAALMVNGELRAAVTDYARTRPIFDEYRRKKYSNKYLAEHDADIQAHREAKATFSRLLEGQRLPKMDALKAEGKALTAKKNAAYRDYRAAKKEMQELVTAKANIDYLLGLTGGSRNKEMER